MQDQSFDLAIVGGGPGGYTAAIRAAQRGLRTVLIERQDLGGLCLNRGCIPSTAMLRSAEVLGLLQHAEDFGLHARDVEGDYAAVVRRRDEMVAQLARGVSHLLEGNGVATIAGEGALVDPHHVEVTTARETLTVEFQHLIVATGSYALPLPIPGADLPNVLDSDGALTLQAAPPRAVVIGGGAVGVEWAEIWAAFGSQVTVLEALPQLIPGEETEVARELARAFERKGISVKTNARVQEIRATDGGLEVRAEADDEPFTGTADVVLVAVGRRPNVERLNLAAAGLSTGDRGIEVDAQMRTSVPHIFAVGDVLGKTLLAHVASHQGVVAAETIAGQTGHAFDPRVVPAAIFTTPEIASVGLTEREARDLHGSAQVGRFPFAASGRAVAAGSPAGFAKIVAHPESGEILGAHVVGHSAAELINEMSLAMRLHATLEDVASTIHVHPTFSEALLEAAWATQQVPVHIPQRRPQK